MLACIHGIQTDNRNKLKRGMDGMCDIKEKAEGTGSVIPFSPRVLTTACTLKNILLRYIFSGEADNVRL